MKKIPKEVWLRVIENALHNTLLNPKNFGAHENEVKVRLMAKNFRRQLLTDDPVTILHTKERYHRDGTSTKSSGVFLQNIRGFMQSEGFDIPPTPEAKISR